MMEVTFRKRPGRSSFFDLRYNLQLALGNALLSRLLSAGLGNFGLKQRLVGACGGKARTN